MVRPMLRFIREYIFQGSILDGKAGVQTAWIAAFYTFNKQARLWAINHGVPQSDPDAIHYAALERESKQNSVDEEVVERHAA